MTPKNTSRSQILRERIGALRARYLQFIEPSVDGLPRLSVLLALPAILVIVGVILVGTSINGSSSGAYYPAVYEGSDPDLIAGAPQAIRSDEWNVGVSWAIAQVQQGLPDRNQTFPGGMDPELPYDLPHSLPSIAFKPHLWGFLFLGVDQAIAWKWWLAGLTLIGAVYLFLVTFNPRRPGLAAVLSVGFFFSPFFQWWYQTSTFWPVAWGMVTMAAMVWATRSRSPLSAWLWAIPVAYATVVMAMGIYAPFIIPVVYVVLFFGLGLVVQELRAGVTFGRLVLKLIPVLVAGLVGAAITAVWLATKSATVASFLGTVYPGERLTPTGSSGAISLARTVSSAFADALRNGAGFLGINSSEASTFFLVGAFLLPIMGWLTYRRAKQSRPVPWTAIAMVAVLGLFVAFTLIPGWDALAHLLVLDRSTGDRLRIGIGVAAFVLLAITIRELDTETVAPGRLLSGLSAGAFVATQFAIGAAVLYVLGAEKLWGVAPLWWVWALLSGLAIYLFARKRPLLGGATFLVVSVASSLLINPIYHGVLDLRETPVSQAIVALDGEEPGAWVGIGGTLASAILLESGVEAYNGTQGAPSLTMWESLDPDHRYEVAWNRIGTIIWAQAPGEPEIINPAPDVIQATFDACSTFAQENVSHVLAEQPIVDSSCLTEVGSYELPDSTLVIYDVVSAKE